MREAGSNLESFQYNATLVITGAIRETSQTKRYAELGLESLKGSSGKCSNLGQFSVQA